MRDLPGMIERELDQIQSQGLLVPETLKEGQEPTPVPALVWERGLIDVDRVQRFWPTAPAHGEAGGSDSKSQLKPITSPIDGDQKLGLTHSRVVYESSDGGVLRNAGYREQDQPSSALGPHR
jgi:hypothetical protein